MACRSCHPKIKRGTARKHLIIPDTQIKPGVPTDHLEWIGNYIAEKKPDVVVMIGDFADMCSLSSYDRGKKTFEGRRYKADIESSIAAMERLMKPIKLASLKGYNPHLVLTLGNHEDRISRAIEDDAKLDGTISIDDLQYKEFGWHVVPYLEPIVIDGISYCHYFTTGVMGRPVGSAQALLARKHMSAVMGHTQQTDCAFRTRADGQHIVGLMVGLCALHDEEYLHSQGNAVRRQIVMLHEVDGRGGADPMFVSLSYLERKYKEKKDV